MSAASIGALAAKIVGRRKTRNDPEHPTDPVRSYSWDVDDERAKPGLPIGDGSVGQGWAFTRACVRTARDILHKHRDARYDGPHRMQVSFLEVLPVMLEHLDYRTGDFYVAAQTIALKCRLHPNTVKAAIACFEYWGLLAHVRRSQRVADAEGQAGPQRKQISNGYYFDTERSMPKSYFMLFWRHLLDGLEKLGRSARSKAERIKATFNRAAKPPPKPSGELAGLLARVQRALDVRDAAAASASP